jgi:hypothetical protein
VTVSEDYYISESPWLMSHQIGWEPMIVDTRLPHWMRVYAVAMARSEPNLHTTLETGELAQLLRKMLPDGSTKPVDRRDLNHYIKKAVELNLLDESSSVRCLVLPPATTACRRQGYRRRCAYHSGKASKIKRPIPIKRETPNPLNRTNSNDVSPQVNASTVGQETRQRRVGRTPTPGSLDIYTVKPLLPEKSPA